ncbi:hypothetical protein CA984_19830 [Streptosporangium minutum]|uniref:HTH merR-type domain-containing protein n=1 Tax=Streptosporangium minutum TaxID=569862 RepID=A0A243RJS6_9ACTN|nr:hypothetical protein CA984_19830 [Streptosporangium minutum]
MRIGELSCRTGVHERLLRYYEQQGLLWPGRPTAHADPRAAGRVIVIFGSGLSRLSRPLVRSGLRDAHL